MFSTCKAVLQQSEILAISKKGLFDIEICSGSVGNWLLIRYLFTLPTYPAAPSWYSWKQKKVQRVVRNRTTRVRWRKTRVLNKPNGSLKSVDVPSVSWKEVRAHHHHLCLKSHCCAAWCETSEPQSCNPHRAEDWRGKKGGRFHLPLIYSH